MRWSAAVGAVGCALLPFVIPLPFVSPFEIPFETPLAKPFACAVAVGELGEVEAWLGPRIACKPERKAGSLVQG